MLWLVRYARDGTAPVCVPTLMRNDHPARPPPHQPGMNTIAQTPPHYDFTS